MGKEVWIATTEGDAQQLLDFLVELGLRAINTNRTPSGKFTLMQNPVVAPFFDGGEQSVFMTLQALEGEFHWKNMKELAVELVGYTRRGDVEILHWGKVQPSMGFDAKAWQLIRNFLKKKFACLVTPDRSVKVWCGNEAEAWADGENHYIYGIWEDPPVSVFERSEYIFSKYLSDGTLISSRTRTLTND